MRGTAVSLNDPTIFVLSSSKVCLSYAVNMGLCVAFVMIPRQPIETASALDSGRQCKSKVRVEAPISDSEALTFDAKKDVVGLCWYSRLSFISVSCVRNLDLAKLCAKKLLPRVPRRLVTRLASGPQSSQKVRHPSTVMFRS